MLVCESILDSDLAPAGFGKVEKRVRTTAGGASGSVRNLRIREDTAKYLLNLDLGSAHYDPKSRSMREDPQPHRPDTEKSFRGDNFVRKNGDFAVSSFHRFLLVVGADGHAGSCHLCLAGRGMVQERASLVTGLLATTSYKSATAPVPCSCLLMAAQPSLPSLRFTSGWCAGMGAADHPLPECCKRGAGLPHAGRTLPG